MTDHLRDIRELMNDTDAYRDELHRPWTGLLSYRYIGRNHGSMNIGEVDDTVAGVSSLHPLQLVRITIMIAAKIICVCQRLKMLRR